MTVRALHQFTHSILEGEEVPLEAAEVLLVLVPKEEKPSSIKGFRQISLCNDYVNMVSKMLVNRLKEILCEVVSLNPASFIPAR